MIDYLFNYPNENAAEAGSVAIAHGATPENSFVWKADHVIEVMAWKPSEDTSDGNGGVIHNYLTGIWLLVSTISSDTVSNGSAHLQMAFDRSGTARLLSQKGNAINIDDFRFEPIFAGSTYPWGAL